MRIIKRFFSIRSPGDFRSFVKSIVFKATRNLLHERIFCPVQLNKVFENAGKLTSELTVSVVIPTYNGVNDGLEALLQSLQRQTHKKIEIIAVDTSSTDGTQNLLEKYGANVITITKEQFKHDFARNLGAEAAKGDYLLFTVQDACFDNEKWIELALAQILSFKDVVSLSSYQYAPSEADLYAQCLSFNFLRGNEYDAPINIMGGKHVKLIWNRCLTEHLRARRVHIDDTNHLVKKDFFLQHQYDIETCEDMGFGKKVIFSGKRFIYTRMLSVKHYHAYKTPGKYARRIFLDNLVINTILDRNIPSSKTSMRGFFDAMFIFLLYATELFLRGLDDNPYADYCKFHHESCIKSKFNTSFVDHPFYRYSKALTAEICEQLKVAFLLKNQATGYVRAATLEHAGTARLAEELSMGKLHEQFDPAVVAVYSQHFEVLIQRLKDVIPGFAETLVVNSLAASYDYEGIKNFYLHCLLNVVMYYVSWHFNLFNDEASISAAVLKQWEWA